MKRELGFSEEHARGLLPYDFRQNGTLSLNMRSLFHLLDVRLKKDAQLEAQWFAKLLSEALLQWSPLIGEWYLANRAERAPLGA